MNDDQDKQSPEQNHFRNFIEKEWKKAWDYYAAGNSLEGVIAGIDVELSFAQQSIASQPIEIISYFIAATRYHQIQVARYNQLQEQRSLTFQRLLAASTRTTESLYIHQYKSLSLAHGAAALAALAYLGNTPLAFNWKIAMVVLFGGVGFLLSLLATQYAIAANTQLQATIDLHGNKPPTDVLYSKLNELNRPSRPGVWVTSSSILLLVMELCFATYAFFPLDQTKFTEHRELNHTPEHIPVPINVP